jgi:hypothetical protein
MFPEAIGLLKVSKPQQKSSFLADIPMALFAPNNPFREFKRSPF